MWHEVKDGHPVAMELFRRHYSYNIKRNQLKFWPNASDALFVGPGGKMVMLTGDERALFVWRREQYTLNGQHGVNCAVFRNEGTNAGRASALIEEAKRLAWDRWPGERLYTYVDPSKVRRKRDPGRCFIKAGFRLCGRTKSGKLIFECLSELAPGADGGAPDAASTKKP